MNPYNFSVLCFSFCSLMIGLFVWLKRQDNVGNTYLWFSFFTACWGIGFSVLISNNSSYEIALLSTRLSNVAASFIPPTWFHVVSILIGEKRRFRLIILLFYIPAALITLFSLTPWFIPGLRAILSFTYYAIPGFIYYIHACAFFLIVLVSFILLVKKIIKSDGPEKTQLTGLCVAAGVGFIGGLLTFLPVFEIAIPQYGIFLMPIYPFLIAYFLIKKQLFSNESIAQAAHRDKLAAIGTLATSINHEIRNPLYVIQGFAQTHLSDLKEGRYENDKQALEKANLILTKALEQTSRAMDIVKRFSSFAKQGAKEASQFEQVNLSKAMEDIVPLVHHELENDQIELNWNLPKNLPPIKADRRQTEEIFFNLIVNACQALKQKRNGKIEIYAEQRQEGVHVEIKDDGPGISEEQAKQIFEPFYTTKEEGTGLGLYITKQLVERNNGSISVESKPGQGTTFKLVFRQ